MASLTATCNSLNNVLQRVVISPFVLPSRESADNLEVSEQSRRTTVTRLPSYSTYGLRNERGTLQADVPLSTARASYPSSLETPNDVAVDRHLFREKEGH